MECTGAGTLGNRESINFCALRLFVGSTQVWGSTTSVSCPLLDDKYEQHCKVADGYFGTTGWGGGHFAYRAGRQTTLTTFC